MNEGLAAYYRRRRREMWAGFTIKLMIVLALVALSFALGIGSSGCHSTPDPVPDALCGPQDAPSDACVCEPHWPTCPPGCAPPIDGGSP